MYFEGYGSKKALSFRFNERNSFSPSWLSSVDALLKITAISRKIHSVTKSKKVVLSFRDHDCTLRLLASPGKVNKKISLAFSVAIMVSLSLTSINKRLEIVDCHGVSHFTIIFRGQMSHSENSPLQLSYYFQ